ncbi:YopT-type cysteine protease domain-containing protein [Bradyrhizobium sp. B097]|uniref:YopT-type cysteine protease domain-containing protein n=1 Tax=Bradyrhizobium sp. B097 TaxID=3140244 RepID=UPI0031834877
MYNRIGDSSGGAYQEYKSSQSMDDGEFARRVADLALQGTLSLGGSCDKMGLCCSKPDVSDAGIQPPSSFNPSMPALPSSSSSSSSEAPIIPLSEYRTAKLRGANVDGICTGLAAEWLLNLPSSPSSRMRALRPGSQTHASAAMRQRRYEDLKGQFQGNLSFQPKDIMFQEAGLRPSQERRAYVLGTSSQIAEIANEVSKDPSIYLFSLRFAGDGAHSVMTSTSNGMTTLFDPNYGEFAVRSDRMSDLLRSLLDDYRGYNGDDIVAVVTQKMS